MVIFFDIDGTLVDDATQILPQSTVRSIHALVENGHIPVLNTGRPYSHVDKRVQALPFAGAVCACGAEVLLHSTWIRKLRIEDELLQKVLRCSREIGLPVVYEVDGGYYLDKDMPKHPEIEYQCHLMERAGGFVRDSREGINVPVIKFVSFDVPGADRTAMVQELAPWFDCIHRGEMGEFIHKGISKAEGLERMLKTLNCPREETMAFGDSGNDLTMFRAVGISICMGNGVAEAKTAATYITSSVVEDGIEKALKNFHLIEGE